VTSFPPAAGCFRLVLLLLLAGAGALRADWQDELSPIEPGGFPPLRPVTLEYQCGWAALTAGRVETQFSRTADDTCLLDATAATTGLVRALWRIDATHEAKGDLTSLMPLAVHQTEVYRAQTINTHLDFDGEGVERLRQSTSDKNPARRKRFKFDNLRDLQTAILYVRSQKLESGATYRMVVYPGTAAYLATVTVLGRERIKVEAGSYPAIKLDLQLEKVTKDMKLTAQGKFKHGTAWLSDDADRLPLKMDAQLFVGSVWVELAKVD